MKAPSDDCKVIFQVTSFSDLRKDKSSLVVGSRYEGTYRHSNRSVWWTDPQNGQNWVFWVNDTCQLVKRIN